MKTILVLAENPEFAEAVRAALAPGEQKVVHRSGVEDAEPLLASGMADACVVDLELSHAQGLWILEKLRRRAPKLPLIVYAGGKPWEWEEEAYLHGVSHVLAKPVRARMLSELLAPLAHSAGDRHDDANAHERPTAGRLSRANPCSVGGGCGCDAHPSRFFRDPDPLA